MFGAMKLIINVMQRGWRWGWGFISPLLNLGIILNFCGDVDKKKHTYFQLSFFWRKKVHYDTKRVGFNNFLEAPNLTKMRQIA